MKVLAIKKEVNLDKLEKFGFKKAELNKLNCYKKTINSNTGEQISNYTIIDNKDRIIKYYRSALCNTLDNTIIELSNANLIEFKDI